VLLKVTYHASNTSSTLQFLSSFKPEIAVIQVGADNSYGHPTSQTPERLQQAGAEVFRNDEHGDVVVTIEDDEANVAITNGSYTRTGTILRAQISKRTTRCRKCDLWRTTNTTFR